MDTIETYKVDVTKNMKYLFGKQRYIVLKELRFAIWLGMDIIFAGTMML